MDRRAEGVSGERRFACTRCGACCNRAPELELGEAAKYAETFVLQLLMRIYSLPRGVADYPSDLSREQASAEYFESKRLLGTFAAASWPAKVRRGDCAVEYVQYLSLSVLPLDLGLGSCSALSGTRCSIYDARPMSCRSVPLHYSRPESAGARALDEFTATPGFLCDTGDQAALVWATGTIVDAALRHARTAAKAQADRDVQLKRALVRAMKASVLGLPSPRDVEASAGHGALTASIQAVWELAEKIGVLASGEAKLLLGKQVSAIDLALGGTAVSAQARETLMALRREYVAALAA